MAGIQDTPLQRIPDEWDPDWFRAMVRDLFSLADVRNADGIGISIFGESGDTAVLVQDAIGETYVVLSPSNNLLVERVLAGETGIITITDNGAGNTVVIGINVFAVNQKGAVPGPLAGDAALRKYLFSDGTWQPVQDATTSQKGVVNEATAVTDLNQTISSPPTQGEVQAISDKVDELLGVMRSAGQLA